MKLRVKKNTGFTLVEMLIYMAILLIVSTAGVTFMISLNDFISEYRVETALYRSGTNALEQVVVSIRQADTFNEVVSATSTATGTLAVADGVSTTIIRKNNAALELEIGGVDYGNLLSDGVEVTEFYVYQHTTDNGNMVRVKLGLQADVSGVSKALTLYGGAVIRGEL